VARTHPYRPRARGRVRVRQPIDLVDDHDVDPPCRDVGEQLLQSGPIYRRAGAVCIGLQLLAAVPRSSPATALRIASVQRDDLRQRVDKPLCCLQIGGAKSFGERLINRRQQIATRVK
jgi:hypothetical protein